jgi:tetratricopeptide (TPR) repeat protein
MRACRKALALIIALCLSARLHATGADTSSVPPVDASLCISAISAGNDERIISECGALIDNDKTAKSDRLKALVARGGAFARKRDVERAIVDYDAALRLDAGQAELFNARGELWWQKGDRSKALNDFGAAIKLNPEDRIARSNYKKLAQELERLGALMAVAGKPSFKCVAVRRPVEKTICASPELADLDRRIDAVNIRVMREARSALERQSLQREQDEFTARRNKDFGKPGYDLEKAMRERLQRLLGADGY